MGWRSGSGARGGRTVAEIPGVGKGIRTRVGSTTGETDWGTFSTGVRAAGFRGGIQVTYGGSSGIGVS